MPRAFSSRQVYFYLKALGSGFPASSEVARYFRRSANPAPGVSPVTAWAWAHLGPFDLQRTEPRFGDRFVPAVDLAAHGALDGEGRKPV